MLSAVEAGAGRTGSTQAMYQSIALVVTLLIAIVSGSVTGKYHSYSWDYPKSVSHRVPTIKFLEFSLIFQRHKVNFP